MPCQSGNTTLVLYGMARPASRAAITNGSSSSAKPSLYEVRLWRLTRQCQTT